MVKVTIYNILDALYQCWLLVSWQGSGHTLSVQSLPIWPASLPAWFLVLRTARGGRPWWSLGLDLGVLPCLAGLVRSDPARLSHISNPDSARLAGDTGNEVFTLHYITLHYTLRITFPSSNKYNSSEAEMCCVLISRQETPCVMIGCCLYLKVVAPGENPRCGVGQQTRQQPYRRSCFIIVWMMKSTKLAGRVLQKHWFKSPHSTLALCLKCFLELLECLWILRIEIHQLLEDISRS